MKETCFLMLAIISSSGAVVQEGTFTRLRIHPEDWQPRGGAEEHGFGQSSVGCSFGCVVTGSDHCSAYNYEVYHFI